MKIPDEVAYKEFDAITTEEEIDALSKSLGIPDHEEPTFDIHPLPDGLPDWPPKAVWELLNQYTRWHEYISRRLTVYQVMERNVEKVYKDIFSYISTNIGTTKKMTIDERKRLTSLNPRVREWDERLQHTRDNVKLLDGYVRTLERNMKSVSRGISVIDTEARAHTREHNVSTSTAEKIKNIREY